MKRKINRRALFVFLLISALNAIVGFDLLQKMEVKRHTHSFDLKQGNAKEGQIVSETFPLVFVSAAIKEKQIPENYLILLRKGGSLYWKKPLEIVLERDKEGLEILSRIMGKAFLTKFLEEEGIRIPKGIDFEALLSGRNYTISEKKLLELYKKYVPENGPLLKESPVDTENESEWIMPDLRGYSMKEAVFLLSRKTTKIKVLGFGEVTYQNPPPKTVVKGDVECVLKGEFN